MDIKDLHEFQKLISYTEYCNVVGETATAIPNWFDLDQMLALSIIYKNMTQTHIFPVNKVMFLHMKDQYKILFIKALAWQIKYVNDNQDLYDNPTGYMSSRQVGTFNRGALSPNEIDKLLNILAPKASYYLEQMGWLYKSLDDHYELCQFYDAEVDDDYAKISDVNKALSDAEAYADIGDQTIKNWVQYSWLQDLESYDKDLFLHTNKETGDIEWAKVEADVTKEYVDTQLALKQNNVIYQEEEPTEAAEGDLWAYKSESEISYNDLTDKPQINGVELEGSIGLSELDLYSQEEVDEKISTGSATYRGKFTAGTTPTETFDYDTFIKSQLPGVTPANGDYVFVFWSTDELYDRCVYSTEDNAWKFQYRVSGKTFNVQYIELYGSKGNVTQEQLDILSAGTQNYIWWAESTINDGDGVILHCTYYNPTVNATYEVVLGDTNYKLNLDIPTKVYTVTQYQFAKTSDLATVATTGSYNDLKDKPEIVENHLYEHNIMINLKDITPGSAKEGSIYFTIYNTSSDTITSNKLKEYMSNKTAISVTGYAIWSFNWHVFRITKTSEDSFTVSYTKPDHLKVNSNVYTYDSISSVISDTVTQIF